MDLRRQLSVLRHWIWPLIAGVLLAGVAAFLISGALPKSYAATAKLIVGQSLSGFDPDYSQLLASQRLSQTYTQLATTTPILERVIATLGLGTTSEELLGRITVEAPRDSPVLHVNAVDTEPERAAAIANAMADELISASPAVQGRQSEVQTFIDAELEAVRSEIERSQAELVRLTGLESRTAKEEQQLQSTQSQLVTLRSTYASLLAFSSGSGSNLLSIVQPAAVPLEPAGPRVLMNTILGALLGLLLVVGIAFLLEYLDDTVKSSEQVEAVTGLPTLGAIARMKGDEKRSPIYRMAALLYPRSPVAEAYRTLRTNVEFALVGDPLRTLLVASAVPGEGKTTTAGNLAVVFAQAGRKTLLLDADMRKPGVHQLFNLPNAHGLSTLFLGDELSIRPLVHPTELDLLSVMTSGPLPPNPAELLRSQRFGAILAQMCEEYDLVIIDSAPLQAVTDAAILASITDGTLLVIDAERTRRGAVARGRDALAKAGARVLGAVVNRLSQRAQGEYYSYHDYYLGEGAEAPGSTAAGTSPTVSAPTARR